MRPRPHAYGDVAPVRLSSRRQAFLELGGTNACAQCFPHGMDYYTHRHQPGHERSWKRHRRTQWQGHLTQRRAAQHRVRRRLRRLGLVARQGKWARGWERQREEAWQRLTPAEWLALAMRRRGTATQEAR